MRAGLAFAFAASQPMISGVRELPIARFKQNSPAESGYHFTEALAPGAVPGASRLSSPVFSPGTGSPLAVVELVEAQPPTAQIAIANKAKIQRYFIRSEV